jgi:glycosyl transferase family 90
MNLVYFIKNYARNVLPGIFFRRNYNRIRKFEEGCDKTELDLRLNYYFKVNNHFNVPGNATAVKDYRKTVGTFYFLDLKEFLHYFKSNTRFTYHFGDETHINPYPTLFKARPIKSDNSNSLLFKLNKRRHFKWINDPYSFSQKKNLMVWRGSVCQPWRADFVKKFWNHPLCDVGQTNKPAEDNRWKKEYMSILEQLTYKFVFCIEGNDVATNLKWAMSSNSLCLMPKPKFETWFMEGLLIAGVHYVEVKSDFSDVEEKINYYSKHEEEAETIISNANNHVKRFQNDKMEELICFKILEKYTRLTGQDDALKFH